MELNWKEDHNLIRKLAKILLGDTLPNGKPVSSIILLDDTSRAELQRWANMSDAEFAAAQLSDDSIHIDVDDAIRQLEEKYTKEFNTKKTALENDYNSRLSSIEKNIKEERGVGEEV